MRAMRWGLWRIARRLPPPSSARPFTTSDLSQLLTSPAGLLTLLWGRTGSRQDPFHVEKSPPNPHEPPPDSQKTEKSNPNSDEPPPRPPREGVFARFFHGDAAGLVVLVVLASTTWELLRAHHRALTGWLWGVFSTTLEIRSSQEEFAQVVDWMGRQPEGQTARNLTLRPVSILDEREGAGSEARMSLVPGYGGHRFRFHGVPLWITRRPDPAKAHRAGDHRVDREDDLLVITAFTRRREVVEGFLAEVRNSWRVHVQRGVRIYGVSGYEGWIPLATRARRPLETLFLPPAAHAVVEEVRAFFGLRGFYAKLGIPWRRGYLFEGAPGTGKTSLVLALAGELGMPVFVLSLRAPGLSDDVLLHHIGRLPARCVLLVEDFENAIATEARAGFREGKPPPVGGPPFFPTPSEAHAEGEGEGFSTEIARAGEASVSLSGFLNAIDGVASGEGRILVMTTNNAARIPARAALLRPGRVDRRVVFPKLPPSEMARMRGAFADALQRPHPLFMDPKEPGEEGGRTTKMEIDLDHADDAAAPLPATPAEFQQQLLNRVYDSLLRRQKREEEDEVGGGEPPQRDL
ncbi:unnamed protein product [Phytomonas sp. EM1]|nr:unnamed protein product [Phytomonas sp. EM1]|eukprot:CCW65662.1 unnamed protein product [Phytomonas sp. isolate EM1]